MNLYQNKLSLENVFKHPKCLRCTRHQGRTLAVSEERDDTIWNTNTACYTFIDESRTQAEKEAEKTYWVHSFMFTGMVWEYNQKFQNF